MEVLSKDALDPSSLVLLFPKLKASRPPSPWPYIAPLGAVPLDDSRVVSREIIRKLILMLKVLERNSICLLFSE